MARQRQQIYEKRVSSALALSRPIFVSSSHRKEAGVLLAHTEIVIRFSAQITPVDGIFVPFCGASEYGVNLLTEGRLFGLASR